MQTEPEINLAVADRDLKYYIFDWDNNILHMPTRIHLEKRTADGGWVPHAVSTAVFSVIRSDRTTYRPPKGSWEEAFREFRDIEIENQNVFLRDTRTALQRVVSGRGQAGPSFETFRRTLVEGRLFAIVTARGHSSEIIRQAVDTFIRTVLTDQECKRMFQNLRGYMACFAPEVTARTEQDVLNFYHEHNRYHGVMSPAFRARMGHAAGASPNTEAGKQFAIKDFVEHVIRIARERGLQRPISVGFSDDDAGNVVAVEQYIRKALAQEFSEVKFVVYYTKDPDMQGGRKVVVHGQMSLDL